MNIPPDYTITPAILALLSEIESLRLYVEKSNIHKHINFTLRRNSLLKSSLYSARVVSHGLTPAGTTFSGIVKKVLFDISDYPPSLGI